MDLIFASRATIHIGYGCPGQNCSVGDKYTPSSVENSLQLSIREVENMGWESLPEVCVLAVESTFAIRCTRISEIGSQLAPNIRERTSEAEPLWSS